MLGRNFNLGNHYPKFKQMKSLKKERKDRGITLEDLSKLTDVTIATLSNIESGKAVAHLMTREKVEAKLGPINWLESRMIDTEPRDPACSWDNCERSFRSLIHEIASLSNEQQKAFCTSACNHLKRLPEY